MKRIMIGNICFHAAVGTDRYRIRIRVDPIWYGYLLLPTWTQTVVILPLRSFELFAASCHCYTDAITTRYHHVEECEEYAMLRRWEYLSWQWRRGEILTFQISLRNQWLQAGLGFAFRNSRNGGLVALPWLLTFQTIAVPPHITSQSADLTQSRLNRQEGQQKKKRDGQHNPPPRTCRQMYRLPYLGLDEEWTRVYWDSDGFRWLC